MTIYIDIIFLENLFMNYIILFATGIILKLPIRIIRTALASVFGSIYAIISYTTRLEIFTSVLLKIILSITIIWIAFNPKNLKEMGKELIIFYLTSFTFGGVAFALLYFVKPQNILLENRCFNRYISYYHNPSWGNSRLHYNNNSFQEHKRKAK